MKNMDDANEKGDDFYEVECVLDKKKVGKQILYRVKWKGYSQNQSTWESHKNLKYCQDIVDLYEKDHQNESSSGQKKTSPPKQKCISIASQSDDIQVHSKNQDGQVLMTSNVSKKNRKRSPKKKQKMFLYNNPIDSIDGQNLDQSPFQVKSTQQRSRRSLVKSNKKSQSKNKSLRKKAIPNDQKSNESIHDDESFNMQFKFSDSEKEKSEKMSLQQKDQVNEQDNKTIGKAMINKQQNTKKQSEQKNKRKLPLKNKESSKKQKLQSKKIQKEAKILLKQSKAKIADQKSSNNTVGVNSIKHLRSKKQFNQKDMITNEIQTNKDKQKLIGGGKQGINEYFANIHQSIKQHKFNSQVQSSNATKALRIRLIQCQKTKQIRDYVVQYENGNAQIFNTLQLFAAHPLEFIEYLESRSIFLK